MKKLLCIAMVLIAALPLAFSQGKTITVRALLPIDFGGTYRVSYSGGSTNTDTNMGFGLGAEAMVGVMSRMKVGVGLQYLINRGNVDDDRTFGFVPVYGLVTYDFNLRAFDPYLIGRIGYNFHKGNDDYTNKGDSDLKGGLAFALGGGASFKIPSTPLHAFVELDYAYNGGQIDSTDISYRRLEALVGVSFTI